MISSSELSSQVLVLVFVMSPGRCSRLKKVPVLIGLMHFTQGFRFPVFATTPQSQFACHAFAVPLGDACLTINLDAAVGIFILQRKHVPAGTSFCSSNSCCKPDSITCWKMAPCSGVSLPLITRHPSSSQNQRNSRVACRRFSTSCVCTRNSRRQAFPGIQVMLLSIVTSDSGFCHLIRRI